MSQDCILQTGFKKTDAFFWAGPKLLSAFPTSAKTIPPPTQTPQAQRLSGCEGSIKGGSSLLAGISWSPNLTQATCTRWALSGGAAHTQCIQFGFVILVVAITPDKVQTTVSLWRNTIRQETSFSVSTLLRDLLDIQLSHSPKRGKVSTVPWHGAMSIQFFAT